MAQGECYGAYGLKGGSSARDRSSRDAYSPLPMRPRRSDPTKPIKESVNVSLCPETVQRPPDRAGLSTAATLTLKGPTYSRGVPARRNRLRGRPRG
jgi:hypothetical protein